MPPRTAIPEHTARHPNEMLIGLDHALEDTSSDLDDYDPIQRDEIMAVYGDGERGNTFLWDRRDA